MAAPLIGSRCEGGLRHASCSGLKRLRLSTTDYNERLVCRHPGKQEGDRTWRTRRFETSSANGIASNACSTVTTRSASSRSITCARRDRPATTKPGAPIRPPSIRSFSTTTSPPSSVSSTEVSHFSRLASSWWDPHGPSRLLHLMNPLRHDFIRSCLSSTPSRTPPHLSYLDVGCGGGIFASSCARLPTTSCVTGIDPTPACIAVAQSHARSDPALCPPPAGKLTYLQTSVESVPSTFSAVDILTLFEVIEHIDVPSSFLSECARHIKPGGRLIGSTISRHPLSYVTTKLIAEAPLVGVVPRGTHDWNKYINPSELREYFETRADGKWGEFTTQGVVYLPTLGWKVVDGSERYGNYFFGVQKLE